MEDYGSFQRKTKSDGVSRVRSRKSRLPHCELVQQISEANLLKFTSVKGADLPECDPLSCYKPLRCNPFRSMLLAICTR